MSKKLTVILSVIVFLLTTGTSYLVFSGKQLQTGRINQQTMTTNTTTENSTNDYQALTFDPNAAKTEACPLNGVMYGKDQKDWWSKHRPLGVMIENSTDARPQSGISLADITYEAMAEGGITRTMNVFYCQDAGIVGPVRSAREYFLQFISEYGNYPLYAHVGGANTPGPANALGMIDDYGWNGYNDLNQFSIGFPTYWRDENRLGHDVATEHTMYSTTSKLWTVGEQRGLTNVGKDGKAWDDGFVEYAFKDDAPASAPTASTIHVPFWGYDGYDVDWTYDKTNNLYLRKNGGAAHMDRNTHKQLSVKDIIILFMKESRANDGYTDNEHLIYDTKGTGNALIFMDGKEIKGTWKKTDRTSRTMLFDTSGNEVKFDRGHLWFEIVGTDEQVTAQ